MKIRAVDAKEWQNKPFFGLIDFWIKTPSLVSYKLKNNFNGSLIDSIEIKGAIRKEDVRHTRTIPRIENL